MVLDRKSAGATRNLKPRACVRPGSRHYFLTSIVDHNQQHRLVDDRYQRPIAAEGQEQFCGKTRNSCLFEHVIIVVVVVFVVVVVIVIVDVIIIIIIIIVCIIYSCTRS